MFGCYCQKNDHFWSDIFQGPSRKSLIVPKPGPAKSREGKEQSENRFAMQTKRDQKTGLGAGGRGGAFKLIDSINSINSINPINSGGGWP